MTLAGLIGRLSIILDIRVVRPGLPNRIGHLVLDFESYIKERLLQGKTNRPIYIVDDRIPANRVVVDYWRRYIRLIDGPLAKLLRGLSTYAPVADNLEHRYAYTLQGASSCFAIEAAWGERPPLFELTDDHRARGEARLREMGLPPGAWFVCVHSRGGGYSPSDEKYHSYRNVSIDSYLPAMQDIIDCGGWCIRMGDPSMEPLAPMPNTIDYACSPLKSDWMDVFLCARCRFFLGSCSGLFLISSVFGVPSALTNMAPLSCVYSVFRKDLTIPKIVLDRMGVPMSFASVFASPIADMRFSENFDAAGVTLVANSPEETRELAREMLDRLDGTFVETAADTRRQSAFRDLIQPHHYSWGSPACIGAAFLRQHEGLIREAGASVA
jgi:putative glycosyltransferase (TIGR04372 family)